METNCQTLVHIFMHYNAYTNTYVKNGTFHFVLERGDLMWYVYQKNH